VPRSCIALGALGATLGAGLLLAACGSNEHVADAGCGPLGDTPSAEAGTGSVAFEPMPDVLPVFSNNSQSDPYLEIHARIRGIPPGNPEDAFDPSNPKTSEVVVIADLGLTLGPDVDHPASLGYVCSPAANAYDMIHSIKIGFGFGQTPIDQVSGKQARITVKIVGANGTSASDEKLVTLMVMSGAAPGTGAAVTVDRAP
jgi:hypothetical protein